MNIQERESGLLVATDTPEPRPEHPARRAIRNALAQLSDALGAMEQTTHGSLGPRTIEGVAQALVECYEHPRAYGVSELSQRIDGLLEGRK